MGITVNDVMLILNRAFFRSRVMHGRLAEKYRHFCLSEV